MAVVKAKPTSAGQRFVVKVVDSELHKGAPHKALISPQKNPAVVTTPGVLPHVIAGVVTNSTIEQSIGSAARTVSLP